MNNNNNYYNYRNSNYRQNEKNYKNYDQRECSHNDNYHQQNTIFKGEVSTDRNVNLKKKSI